MNNQNKQIIKDYIAEKMMNKLRAVEMWIDNLAKAKEFPREGQMSMPEILKEVAMEVRSIMDMFLDFLEIMTREEKE